MLPNLKLLRKEYQISQQKLAEALEVSQQSVNQYENHAVEPDIAVLTRMADYFHTSIDYIVGRTNDRWWNEHEEIFHLNPEERRLIQHFRTLSSQEKACLVLVADTLNSR